MAVIKQPNKPKTRTSKWKILRRLLLILTLTAATGLAVITVYVFINLRSLPEIDSAQLNTFETSKILDSEGNIIWQPTDQHISIMTYDEIPELYRDGLLAVEDGEFWTSNGYSTKGITTMIGSVILSKFIPSIEPRGGSTLEQQLIKNVYFGGGADIKTTTRKIQEIYLAQQLDHNFSKKDILTHYVNNLSFAEGDIGIKAVMMTYFGKSPTDYQERTIENIAEQAYMVGLGQNPTTFNLYEQPKEAHQRTKTVLGVLLESDLITKAEYDEAVNYNLEESLQERYWESVKQQAQNLKYKSYTDEVLKQVHDMGYDINTVSVTIKTHLKQSTFDSIVDTVRSEQYYQDSNQAETPEQVGVSVIDHNGIVVGMVGSRFEGDELNRATQRTRSSGSSSKPFTAFGPEIQYMGDVYNTATPIDSSNYTYPGTNMVMHNWGDYTYGNVSMQRALRMSLNTVVARLDDEVLGTNRMKEFLNGVGLDTQPTYSAIDGIGLYVSSLDIAAAYNALNNGGIYTKPRFITELSFSDGSSRKIEPESKRVMNESTAYVLNQMLRGVMAPGYTGTAAAINNYQGYAGKTGTVELDPSSPSPNIYGSGGSDSWFASITNGGYSVAVWFGYDNPNTSPQVADVFDGPELLGRDLQLQLNGDRTVSNWSRPKGVEVIGGKGIETEYRITDAKDINNNIQTITNVDQSFKTLNSIMKLQPEVIEDDDWIEDLSELNKYIYNKYDNGTDINPNVIHPDLYNKLP